MATLSLSVTRDGDDPLVIGPTATSLWVESLTRAGASWRRTYASSAFHHGATMTAATLNHAQMDAVIYAKAASASALQDMRDEVFEAFSQFAYTLTVTESGVALDWACDPADVAWNEHDSGMANTFLARATLAIPCYPLAVS